MPSIRLLQQQKLKEKFNKQLKELESASSSPSHTPKNENNNNNNNINKFDGNDKEMEELKVDVNNSNDKKVEEILEKVMTPEDHRRIQQKKLNISYRILKAIVKGYIVRLTLYKLPRSVTLIKTIQDSNNILKELGTSDPLYTSIHKYI